MKLLHLKVVFQFSRRTSLNSYHESSNFNLSQNLSSILFAPLFLSIYLSIHFSYLFFFSLLDGAIVMAIGGTILRLRTISSRSRCIRPCNIAFGADQFDTNTKGQIESFFNWRYLSFTINLHQALAIALTRVVYIQTEISWTISFAIPTACLSLSITIFLIG